MFYEPIYEYEGHKLVRRPDTNKFHITWCRPGSGRMRRKSTGTSDLESAKQRLRAFVDDRKLPVSAPADQVILLALLAEYVGRTLRGKQTWRPETTALKHWERFLTSADVVYVSEFTRPIQEQYVAWRRETLKALGHKGSNGTIARELRVMRAALNDAWQEGVLPYKPRVIGLSEPPPRQRFLFRDEVSRLIAACDEPYLHTFVMIALHTLQRPSAIFELRAEQVDLRAGRIDFLPPDVVQTRKRRPVVPISRTLAPILTEAIEESSTGFLIERNRRPVGNVRKSFAAACRRAGLNDVTPYTLRHTGATLLLAAGVPIRQVAGMLGHTEQRTTELYGKHHVDFLGQASNTLDELFPGYAPGTRQFRVIEGQSGTAAGEENACKALRSVVPSR